MSRASDPERLLLLHSLATSRSPLGQAGSKHRGMAPTTPHSHGLLHLKSELLLPHPWGIYSPAIGKSESIAQTIYIPNDLSNALPVDVE